MVLPPGASALLFGRFDANYVVASTEYVLCILYNMKSGFKHIRLYKMYISLEVLKDSNGTQVPYQR